MAQDINEKIRAAAQAKNVDPEVALRIANVESGGKPAAKNPRSSAEGIFQIIDDTWRRYGGRPGKKLDADENIRVGTDILADNTAKLTKALGRSPQGHEVYTAHFFGPEKGKQILQADPATPLNSLLSKDVLKANPELRNQTVGQFLGNMQNKMGKSNRSAGAGMEAGPTPSEETMTKALGQNIAGMGTGYQAALALSFLSDEKGDKEDDEEDKDSGPSAAEQLAQYKPVNSLEGMDIGYSSPFAQPQAAQPQQVAQAEQPQVFAHGGVVHRADGSPEGGEERLKEVYLDPGMKTEYSNAPKRSAKEMLAYMQAQNPSVLINKTPMDSNTMGYVNSRQPDVVNINPDQSPAREELTKLHELEHSMAMRSGDILGRPEIRGQDNAYRAYHLLKKDWTPIRQFAYNMASNKDKLEKFFGQPMDSGYLNMSKQTLDDIRNRGDALQGLAEEQMASLSALEQTTGKFLTQDPEMRKLFPSTKMMAVYDALTGPRQTRMDARDLPPHTPAPSYMYQDNPVLKVIQKHLTGEHEYGIPIKRAEGSPETGEIGPAFGNPNIQRQGAKARALAAQRDVNTLPDPKTYAAVSGFLGTPFHEQGWSVFHPKRQGIETAADVGYAAGLGAQIAPVAAPVLKGTAKLVGSGINERLLSGQSLTPGFNTPAPINFAVKEPGGHFLHNRYEGVDDVDSFLKNFAGVKKDDESPLNQWMYKRYGNYMRGQMGTEMDPFVKGADAGKVFHFMDEAGKVHMPQYAEHAPYLREKAGLPMGGFAKTSKGQDMETAIDTSLSPVAVGDVSDRNLTEHMTKLRDKDPSAPVYEVLHEELDDVLKPAELRSSLRTMMRDKTLPPEYQLTEEQLKKMSLLDASEKAAQFDKYIVARDNEIRMRAAESIPVFKQYDDGSKWLAPEDTMHDAASKEYVLQTGKHAGWCTERESNCLSYGAGDNRLFILTDKEGKPMVQINKEEHVPDVTTWLKYGMDPEREAALRDEYMIHQLEQMPEYQQWAKANSRVAIGEIKGRNNSKELTGEALEKARDFVRSGTWDAVDEISHAKLTDLRDEVYKAGKAVDLAPIENEAKRRFGTIYLTDDELNQIKPMLDENGKASGGMIERNTGDNRRYL